MNALIIYDDCALAAKANAILEQTSYRMNDAVHWDVKPWRAEMLKFAPAANKAMTEAEDAHLIVLAVNWPQSLPGWLVAWLEQWATRRQIQEAALGLLQGRNDDTLSASATRGLSQFTGRHGLSFIVGDMGPTQVESVAPAPSLHEREVLLTPAPQHIADGPIRNGYRGWGINE